MRGRSEHGARIAAGKLGITVEELWQHEERGERWCPRCASWQPDNGTPYCRPCRNSYERGRSSTAQCAYVRYAGPAAEART